MAEEDKQEPEEEEQKQEEDEEDPYPVPDLGEWNDRAFKYPKKGTNLGFIRYQEKDWEVYLTYKHPNYPRSEAEIFGEYAILRERNQRIRRLLLGEFLMSERPDEERIIMQFLIDMAEPQPFEEFYDDVENTAEGEALFEALDMATSVLQEGGSCIDCGAEPDPEQEGVVDHKVGCRLVSWMLWRLGHPEEQDRQPSMEMVVKAARDQIARMA